MFSDCFDTSGSMIALLIFEILALDGFCDEEELGILVVGLKLPKTYMCTLLLPNAFSESQKCQNLVNLVNWSIGIQRQYRPTGVNLSIVLYSNLLVSLLDVSGTASKIDALLILQECSCWGS